MLYRRLNSATKVGFDIVIGNPPYVRKTQMDDKLKSTLEKKYFSAYKQYDIYLFFNELALILLKKNGVYSFIQPNKFLSAEYGFNLINLLKNNAIIKTIWNVSLNKVFEASVYPYVFIFQKKSFSTNFINDTINLLEFSEKLVGFNTSQDAKSLMAKIRMKSIQLKTIADKIKRGVANTKIEFNIQGKYSGIKSTILELSYFLPNTNTIFDYLSENEEKRKIEEFSKNMILLPRTVQKIRAIYKSNNQHVLDRVYYFECANEKFEDKFILAILNSKVTTFYYDQIYGSTKIGGGYIDLKGSQIENLMIPNIATMQQQPIIVLVNQILSTKSANPIADISELEKQIDRLVYNLYKLTDEEIAIIEK